MTSEQIIAAIDRHSTLSGLRPSTICQYALQNRAFYDRLKSGGDCQMGTVARLMSWLADNAVHVSSPSTAPVSGSHGEGSLPAKSRKSGKSKFQGAAK